MQGLGGGGCPGCRMGGSRSGMPGQGGSGSRYPGAGCTAVEAPASDSSTATAASGAHSDPASETTPSTVPATLTALTVLSAVWQNTSRLSIFANEVQLDTRILCSTFQWCSSSSSGSSRQSCSHISSRLRVRERSRTGPVALIASTALCTGPQSRVPSCALALPRRTICHGGDAR